MIFTSIPAIAFAETNTSSKDSDTGKEVISEEQQKLEDTLALEEDVSEENFIEEESTEDMSVFQLEGNPKKAIFYSDAVRFEDEDGNLCDYQPELVETTADAPDGYSYENKAGDSKQYLPETLTEDTPVLLEKDKYRISILPCDGNIENSNAEIKSEETVNLYEQVEEVVSNIILHILKMLHRNGLGTMMFMTVQLAYLEWI